MKEEHNNRNRIRGSLKPIVNTIFFNSLNYILNTSGALNTFTAQYCRETLKEVVAQYLKHPFIKFSNDDDYKVNQNSKTIFINFLKRNSNNAVHGFADCCLNYFNGDREISLHLDLSIPECNSGVFNKALKKAMMNSKKIVKQKFNKIYKKMENNEWNNVPDYLFNDYKGIETAVTSVCTYIYTINTQKIPSALTVDLYNKAYNLDNTISKYFKYVPSANYYKIIKNESIFYSSLKQECATLIFCYSHSEMLLK